MGEVIYGVDFKARREKEAIENYNTVMRALILIIDQAGGEVMVTDTSPSEMPPDDCA